MTKIFVCGSNSGYLSTSEISIKLSLSMQNIKTLLFIDITRKIIFLLVESILYTIFFLLSLISLDSVA